MLSREFTCARQIMWDIFMKIKSSVFGGKASEFFLIWECLVEEIQKQ